jgi:hypothetical protein
MRQRHLLQKYTLSCIFSPSITVCTFSGLFRASLQKKKFKAKKTFSQLVDGEVKQPNLLKNKKAPTYSR